MRPFWRFWLPWVLTNVVAVATALAALSGAIQAGVSGVIPEVVFAPVWASGLLWGFTGALIGGGQWLVLRRLLPGAGRWVWASALGTAVGVAAMFLAFIATGGEAEAASAPDLAVIGTAGGAAVGASQWLVLRRLVRRARWWVLTSAAGAGGGVLTYSLLTGDNIRLPVLLVGGGTGGVSTV